VLDAALSEGQLSMEEHRQRVNGATRATTLGELQSLVSDLQIHRAPVQLPKLQSPARWGMWIAVAAVLALLVAGIAWGVWGSSSSPSSSPSKAASATSATSDGNGRAGATMSTTPATPPQSPPQLLTLGGLTGFLAQMRQKFGDAMGYELTVYPEYAVVTRPDSANAHKTVMWYYSNLGWMNLGNMPPPLNTAVGDLSKFDVQAVLGVLRDAPQTLHVNDATETYIIIDSGLDGSLTLDIHASNPDTNNGGYLRVAPDGTAKDVHPAGS
jgi:hypothetical protein